MECLHCTERNGLRFCARCKNVSYCSKKCQTLNHTIHRHTCSANVEVKGIYTYKGLFSKKEFMVGDEILREKPLLKLPQCGNINTITAAVLSTTPSIFKLLSEFTNKDHDNGWLGVFQTNSVPTGPDHASMFAFISRANHSCDANARFVWRPDLKRELLIAQRPVSIGDELTVEYGDMLMSRKQRGNFLLEKHKFVCACELCTTRHSAKVDDTLREIKELTDEVPRVGWKNPAKALRMSERSLALIKKSGLGKPLNLHSAHYDAYQMAEAINSWKKAKYHISKCFETITLAEGVDCPSAGKYSFILGLLAGRGV